MESSAIRKGKNMTMRVLFNQGVGSGGIEPSSRVTERQATVPRRKILIVESHPQLRGTLVDYFERYYDVVTAVSGQDGLNKFNECSPGAVIMDPILLGQDGEKLMIEIRKLNPNVPIIVHTLIPENVRDKNVVVVQKGKPGLLLQEIKRALGET